MQVTKIISHTNNNESLKYFVSVTFLTQYELIEPVSPQGA